MVTILPWDEWVLGMTSLEKKTGRAIWPPHSDWTVRWSGGGTQHHKGLPVCLQAQNLSVIVGDRERETKGIDGERWGGVGGYSQSRFV